MAEPATSAPPPSETLGNGNAALPRPPMQMGGNMPPMGPPYQGPPPGMGMMMAPPPRMGPGPGMMPPGGPMSVGMPTPPMGSVMMRPPNLPPAPGPGMPAPSPIVDKNGEMWLEHKAPDGRTYYGNVRTRQTIWTRPEQADPNKPPPPVPNPGPPPGGPPPMSSGGPPPMQPVGNSDGPPMAMGMQQPPPMMGPPGGVPMGMPMSMPPMQAGPPPGAMPMMMPPRPAMPLMAGGPPPMAAMPPFPTPPGGNPIPPGAQARVWSEHKHPDGRTYYYNRLTTKSEWKKPEDFDTAMAPITQVPIPPPTSGKPDNDDASKDDADEKKDDADEPKDKDADKSEENGSEEKMDADEKDEKPSEPTRPIATKPVPGHAPWVIVFTSDDRVFFFNQSNSQSFWSIPEELQGIDNLEELMKTPRQRAEQEAARRAADREAEVTKRPADATGEPPAKRPALDTSLDPKEEGLTIEQRAQRMRATLTLEERQQEFKALLAEKKVSAFSTWERELSKLVCDIRYLLLSAKERKVAFDQYLRTRAEEERKEKKDQHKGKRADFRTLLEEADISTKRASFSDFAMKHGRDKRFKAIDRMKERENLFHDFVEEQLQRLEKIRNEEASSAEKAEKEFLQMLKEDTNLSARSHWKKIKDDFKDDDRYHVVDGSDKREELFKKYRQRLIDEKEAKEMQEREREDRIAASIKERARQVELARSEHQREVEIGRSNHIKEEAEQAMKALLADLVRDASTDWDAAGSVLRRDHRWKNLDALTRERKEKIFDDHCADLRSRKRTYYNRLLNEIPGLTLGTTWKEVKKIIRSDSKYDKFANDPGRKEEFQRFLRDKTSSARDAYRKLLQETRVVTHKSRELWHSSESYQKEILGQLEKDSRHLIMDSIAEERDEMLQAHMKELQQRGPPPPPTASDSTARYARKR
ncbi:transcription elongation regulator 1-like [Sycon ciliatum]|uniref:transcription elongation regulator 1-like n=1 Tax=Sycon ciliatum TaxID=27933 RepID=UPI0020ABE3CF|eukprot:scpid21547/ scgid9603/ Transcription elongation regulator 1; Formin-binding protein 28; TATA box-binding protein-associated factor 2S; Transcription factor CA150; p144